MYNNTNELLKPKLQITGAINSRISNKEISFATVNPLDPDFDETVLQWYEKAESDVGISYFGDNVDVFSEHNDESYFEEKEFETALP
ncbi:hypothetical protein FQA39_LY02194 [Lamprigera yunnana]|nr:hypothetical protein FQA39_LY02194 [Lamprigera yunnana]